MTTHEYIEFIRAEFESGKKWIEIPTDTPRKLYDNLRYKSYACKLHWHFQILDNSLIVRPATEKVERKEKKRPLRCDCKRYGSCTECRNRERRTADKEGRLPVYLTSKIAPDALKICLEVAASD